MYVPTKQQQLGMVVPSNARTVANWLRPYNPRCCQLSAAMIELIMISGIIISFCSSDTKRKHSQHSKQATCRVLPSFFFAHPSHHMLVACASQFRQSGMCSQQGKLLLPMLGLFLLAIRQQQPMLTPSYSIQFRRKRTLSLGTECLVVVKSLIVFSGCNSSKPIH